MLLQCILGWREMREILPYSTFHNIHYINFTAVLLCRWWFYIQNISPRPATTFKCSSHVNASMIIIAQYYNICNTTTRAILDNEYFYVWYLKYIWLKVFLNTTSTCNRAFLHCRISAFIDLLSRDHGENQFSFSLNH